MRKITVILISFLVCSNVYAQWSAVNSGTGANLKTVYFLNSQTGLAGGSGGVILKTTNAGINWNQQVSGISNDINSISFINTLTGFACANSGNIIFTTNSGSAWSPVTSGTSDNLNSVSFFNSTNGVCTGTNGTLMFTSNGGLNWTISVNGFLSTYYGIHMVSAGFAYACGVNTIFQPLVAKTTNGGANWSYFSFYLNSNEGNLRDIRFLSDNEGYAVSNVWNGQGGISYTSNGGINWITQLVVNSLNGLELAGPAAFYAVGSNGSILKSTDNGTSWFQQLSGVSSILRSVDFVDLVNGFAVGDGGVILKTTNGGVTGITPIVNEMPDEFELLQNYPNPFNPSTTISFSVPSAETARRLVILKIYDALGRQLTILVNEKISPGTYEVNWNASSYSSGVYYYELTSGDFRESRRMILIK